MSKNSIYVDGLKIISNKIIPFGNYVAITMFGKVFTRKSMKDLTKYLESTAGKVMVRHESIHVLQAKDCKSWIKFYWLYLWYFFKMLFRYFRWSWAYRTIPFEIEAYKYQSDINPHTETNWREFIMSNKERKQYYIDKYVKKLRGM